MSDRHTLSRRELATVLAEEFFGPNVAQCAASATAELLPEQHADLLAARNRAAARARGFAAFIATMVAGALICFLYHDLLLAGMVLLAGAGGSFARARAIHIFRGLNFLADSSTEGRALDEERAHFRASILPVLRLSHPSLFVNDERSAG